MFLQVRSLTQVLGAKIKVLAGLLSFLEAQGENWFPCLFGLLASPFCCDCHREMPISLFSASRGHLYSSAGGHHLPSLKPVATDYFHCWSLSSSFCLISLTRKVSQFLRTQVTGSGLPNHPGSSHQVPCPWLYLRSPFTGYSLGVQMWTSLGSHDSAYHNLSTLGV